MKDLWSVDILYGFFNSLLKEQADEKYSTADLLIKSGNLTRLNSFWFQVGFYYLLCLQVS